MASINMPSRDIQRSFGPMCALGQRCRIRKAAFQTGCWPQKLLHKALSANFQDLDNVKSTPELSYQEMETAFRNQETECTPSRPGVENPATLGSLTKMEC
ncbi:hypothetical protein PG985_007901 [Apiospora marii]|uniref:Uncharacterized protein n=1 Tax=Apiospora marii TaxID=335849 RepID=A0ABR1R8Z1_9PEZI